MRKRCLILYNRPAENALPDELDVLDQVGLVDKALAELGYEVERYGLTEHFFDEIAAIAGKGYDFVFNLAESVGGRAEILYFVPALLNMHHIPYTGCPVEAAFITGSKTLARSVMKASGIPVAAGFSLSSVTELVPGSRYILKPVWEDGSLGITEESVFTYNGEIPAIVRGKDERHWFIEEYIDGREFNVSIVSGKEEPVILPPAEMLFHQYPEHMPKIVSYKAKWEEETFQYQNSRRHFPTDIAPLLMDKIVKAVTACWNTFGLRGYARIDLRCDASENVYVLEANANPCISPDSGFVAAAARAGFSTAEVVGMIAADLNL